MIIRTAFTIAALASAAPLFAADTPIEPIEVPASIEQGLDMVYIDREIAPAMERRDDQLESFGFEEWKAAPIDMFLPVHPLYTDLRRALVRYQVDWAGLPQIDIPAGPVLKIGNSTHRIRFGRDLARFMSAWCALGPTHHVALGLGHHAADIARVARLLDLPLEVVA